MAKILVTGGAGYIGSHTVIELEQAGHSAIILDNLSNSSDSALKGIKTILGYEPTFYKGDVNDTHFLNKIINDEKPEGVIHFAAYKAVGESVEKPLLYYHNNVSGLISLLEAMQKNNLDVIVFSSSCTVYGQPALLPVNETAPVQKAESPYGNTKKICEEILQDCTFLKCISLRYFNPIGAHDSSHIGELPLGVPNNLVPFITQTAAGIRKQLTVFGTDYNTPDGSCIRDYLHVVDLAKAHVVAINRLLNNKNTSEFEVFNLGTGKGSSVLEVIYLFEKVCNVKLNYIIGNRRPGDVEQVWADATKANNILGWKAERPLEDMLLSAWKWQKALSEQDLAI